MASSHPHVFTPTRLTKCQGFAKTTGRQCGRYRSIGRFCNFHAYQAGKCRAIAREGSRCSGDIDPEGREYFCAYHRDWATPDEAVCQGFRLSHGEQARVRCYRRVTHEGYQFCTPKHDDRVEYNDPRKLRPLNHRTLQPRDRRDGQDRYNPGRILQEYGDTHIDHIGELQIEASVFSYVAFQDPEEKAGVVTYARDEVLNESFNLCRTQATTNLAKGNAVTKFIGDAMVHSIMSFGWADQRALTEIRDAPIIETFDYRLREKGLGRDSTRAITREMKRAFKTIVTSFSDQAETPVFNEIAHVTLTMAHAMGISTDLGLRLD